MTPQKPDQFNEPPTPLGVAVEMERWVLDNGGDAECWDWIGATAIRDLIAERDDLQRTFDATWAAQMRAITAWQERHDEPLTWPDHAKLVEWLLEERERVRAAGIEALNVLIGCAAPMGGCDGRRDYDNAIDGLKRALGYKP